MSCGRRIFSVGDRAARDHMAEQRGRLHVLVEGQTEEALIRDVFGFPLEAPRNARSSGLLTC